MQAFVICLGLGMEPAPLTVSAGLLPRHAEEVVLIYY